jgi:hypothetical protein
MLLLVKRLTNSYAGEGSKTVVGFSELIIHDKPERLPGKDIRKAVIATLCRFVSPNTAEKLIGNMGTSVGDYTLMRDELDNSYTLSMNVDLMISAVDGDGVVAGKCSTIIEAILFQIYELAD